MKKTKRAKRRNHGKFIAITAAFLVILVVTISVVAVLTQPKIIWEFGYDEIVLNNLTHFGFVVEPVNQQMLDAEEMVRTHFAKNGNSAIDDRIMKKYVDKITKEGIAFNSKDLGVNLNLLKKGVFLEVMNPNDGSGKTGFVYSRVLAQKTFTKDGNDYHCLILNGISGGILARSIDDGYIVVDLNVLITESEVWGSYLKSTDDYMGQIFDSVLEHEIQHQVDGVRSNDVKGSKKESLMPVYELRAQLMAARNCRSDYSVTSILLWGYPINDGSVYGQAYDLLVDMLGKQEVTKSVLIDQAQSLFDQTNSMLK